MLDPSAPIGVRERPRRRLTPSRRQRYHAPLFRLGPDDTARLREVGAELDTIRLDGRPVLDVVLPPLRELLRAEGLVAMHPTRAGDGWDLDLFAGDGPIAAPGIERRWADFFAHAPERYAWYNAIVPEPEQRNRVLEATERIPRDDFESSRVYTELLEPLKLHRHRQLRALVCDGPVLLAWFGAFHPEAVDARQTALLQRVVPFVRRRLSLERRLGMTRRGGLAFDAAIDSSGAPTFLVNRNGRAEIASPTAKALIERSPGSVRRRLGEAIATQRGCCTVARAVGPAANDAFLVILSEPAEVLEARLGAWATRYCLTKREREVLRWVAEGDANKEVATKLGCHEGTVERHVTSLLRKSRCDSRSRLIARFWTDM